ncbi:hypothetical protein Q4Q35_09025 [Flavivirga aquimarina]|uniref:Uncharacterized protein n=1 Tax=Flavivirga aquimarina TaxID=2027862 RepID=A0ABT8W9X8_9FLAO|nr:hypothetical protein [Flavivirga aquimarina]MDO5969951.1 hypothetical protein [Flavivirga aquimarina]
MKPLFLVLSILMAFPLNAQNFTPQVKKFILIDTSIVAITNVKVIDGKSVLPFYTLNSHIEF